MNRQQFIDYVQKKYDTKPDHPWEKFPDYAVFRHSDNDKCMPSSWTFLPKK